MPVRKDSSTAGQEFTYTITEAGREELEAEKQWAPSTDSEEGSRLRVTGDARTHPPQPIHSSWLSMRDGAFGAYIARRHPYSEDPLTDRRQATA
jgi:hypothetical protein